MEPTDNKKRLATGLKWTFGLITVAIFSPMIVLALKGVLGLMAIFAAVGIGGGLLKLAPWASMKISNVAMKLIMHEARINPIETLENLKVEKTLELQAADNAVVDFETSVRNFDDKIVLFKRKYPNKAAEYTEISGKMHESLEQQRTMQKVARSALADLGSKIDEAHAIYEMALAVEQVTKLSNSAEAKVFQDIKQKIAFDSVQSGLNHAFASLNMAVDQKQFPLPQESLSDPSVIEPSFTYIKGAQS
jgi:hypothetical protein